MAGRPADRGRAGLRAWLELARLSNLPTCVSNILVGVAIGSLTGEVSWSAVGAVTGAVMLLYVAGMALNDVVDHRIDQRERPQRPIPSGRISVGAATALAVVCIVTALGLTALAGWRALAIGAGLSAVIVVYDLVHKRVAASAALMGVCRGLVYLLAASAVGWPLDWTVAITLVVAMTVYIALVTVVARREAGPNLDRRSRCLSLVLPALVLVPIIVIRPAVPAWSILAAIAVTVWLLGAAQCALARPPRTRSAVLRWLTGICLVDGLYLTLLDRPGLALAALGCFVVTAAGHRRILGT